MSCCNHKSHSGYHDSRILFVYAYALNRSPITSSRFRRNSEGVTLNSINRQNTSYIVDLVGSI